MNVIIDSIYMAHGICLLWKPWLIGLHFGADILIFAAYMAIPFAILMFLRKRRDIKFPIIATLFAAFIVLCGLTHLIGAVTLWVPIYEVEAVVKGLTAIVSVSTAIVVFTLLPRALSIPSAEKLEEIIAERTQELEDANEKLHVLTRELAHRSKNIIAVVQAIASQTVRETEDPADIRDRLNGRLKALALAIDAVSQNEEEGADLWDLIDSQLAPYFDAYAGRVEIEGPRETVRAAAAQDIGLMVHELATNAIKHGALSKDEGTVRLTWGMQGELMVLEWKETTEGGLEPSAGTGETGERSRRSFGATLIDQVGPRSLGGRAEREFTATGMHYRLEVPAAGLVVREPPAPEFSGGEGAPQPA